MATKLFVGGLAWGTTEESLNSMFAEAGSVVSAVVIKDKFTNRSKGFGFVEMSSQEEADKAVEMFNGKELDGRAITVNEARPMEPRENRGGSDRRY
ncbi:RNA-binding protein [Candidatus Curtissbacteria bacterium]|nr:RNA-binding protein [Candidatus Curtissbacteria bacterium]